MGAITRRYLVVCRNQGCRGPGVMFDAVVKTFRRRKMLGLLLLWLLACFNFGLFLLAQTFTPMIFQELQTLPKHTLAVEIRMSTVGRHREYKAGNITVNTTVVTAYFDMGDYIQGREVITRSMLGEWARLFSYMYNPLVVYTDSTAFYNYMRKIRANTTKLTKLFIVNREELWSFRILDQIRSIYEKKGYPKYHPNTVKPEYSSSRHAKFELMGQTVHQKLFNTEFFCWVDIDYFRKISKSKVPFVVIAPPDLSPDRIAMTELTTLNSYVYFTDIILNNKVWVDGGMFIGTSAPLIQLTKEYKAAVEFCLREKVMNIDEQILYTMYSAQARKILNPTVKLQLYRGNKEWFRLGYIAYRKVA